MKRTYKTPALEVKECAQLENVFTYCDKYPSTEPECYKAGEGEPPDGSNYAESCDLGYSPNRTDGVSGCMIGGSDGDLNP